MPQQHLSLKTIRISITKETRRQEHQDVCVLGVGVGGQWENKGKLEYEVQIGSAIEAKRSKNFCP